MPSCLTEMEVTSLRTWKLASARRPLAAAVTAAKLPAAFALTVTVPPETCDTFVPPNVTSVGTAAAI